VGKRASSGSLEGELVSKGCGGPLLRSTPRVAGGVFDGQRRGARRLPEGKIIKSEVKATPEEARRVLQAAAVEAYGRPGAYVVRDPMMRRANVSDLKEFWAIAEHLNKRDRKPKPTTTMGSLSLRLRVSMRSRSKEDRSKLGRCSPGKRPTRWPRKSSSGRAASLEDEEKILHGEPGALGLICAL